MAFLRFEDLRVFQLAEKLCDEIWDIVTSWEYFEKSSVGLQLVKLQIASVPISQRVPVEERPRTINALSESQEDL